MLIYQVSKSEKDKEEKIKIKKIDRKNFKDVGINGEKIMKETGRKQEETGNCVAWC